MRDVVVDFVRFDNTRDNSVTKVARDRLGAVLGDQHVVRSHKNGPAVSFATYKPPEERFRNNRGGERLAQNVASVNLVCLDADHVLPSRWETILEGLDGLAFATYTTHGHLTGDEERGIAPAVDGRYRILFPVTRTIMADEWPRLWRLVSEMFGIPSDPQAADVSRIWFLPAVPPGMREHARLEYRDGLPLDVDAILLLAPREPVPPPEPSRAPTYPPGSVHARAEAYVSRMEPSVSGEGGHSAAWSAALALVRGFSLSQEDALSILRTHFNPRCLPPWSEKDLRHKIRSVARAACRVPDGYLLSGDFPLKVIRARWRTWNWSGKAGTTDRAVMGALLEMAERTGSLVVPASVRHLAEATGIRPGTAAASLKRLSPRWAQLFEESTEHRARVWLLCDPEPSAHVSVSTLSTSPPPGIQSFVTDSGNLTALDIPSVAGSAPQNPMPPVAAPHQRHRAWTAVELHGHDLPFGRLLEDGPMSATVLAGCTGQSVKRTRIMLTRLERHGLVRKGAARGPQGMIFWEAVPDRLDAVAAALDLDTKETKTAHRHQRDRDGYHGHLRVKKRDEDGDDHEGR